MENSAQILDSQLHFDPAEDLERWLKSVPAKWAVYLMSDGQGMPVQLLCVKNLRASLQRRLSGEEPEGPSRRIAYRDLVRQIFWRRVDSVFEADLIYLESARQIFPESYRGMLAFKETWFLHVDPVAAFPRYLKTNDLTVVDGELFGPLKDKEAAGRFIELIEDAFDLCRYYNILTEAPNGRSCAYKEMGKCPAPCDGSISMDQYRRMIALSLSVLVDPTAHKQAEEQAMQRAAQNLDYEQAAKIKNHLQRIARLRAGALALVRPISQFYFLSLQRGPRARTAKIFLIAPARIVESICLRATPTDWTAIVEYLHLQARQYHDEPVDRAAGERLAIVASHLFTPKKQGVIMPISGLTAASIQDAYRRIQKQKQEPESTDEGVMRDLQRM